MRVPPNVDIEQLEESLRSQAVGLNLNSDTYRGTLDKLPDLPGP